MKTETQIFLDRTLIRALIFFLNFFVRILGKILNIDHSLDKSFKTIAVCKYKGLGSIIQATPLLQTLRANYPEAKIIFVSTKGNEAFLKKIKCIDEIITLDDSGAFKLLADFPFFIFKLLRLRIELFFDLEIYSNFSSLAATFSASRNRIGFYLRSSNYRLGIYTHMMYYNIRVPIFQTYLQMARMLGCRTIVEELYKVGYDTPHFNHQPFKEIKPMEYIVINPNASDLRLERRWGADNFAALINNLLISYPQYHVVIIGGKSEKPYVDSLLQNVDKSKRLINTAGITTIDQLISIINHALLLITNDTGPMHLAFSLKTRTVALFGPCSPEQYGNKENSYSIYHKTYCSPCVHEFVTPPCAGNNSCMKLIKTEEVKTAVDIMIKGNDAFLPMKDENIYKMQGDYPSGKETLGFIKRRDK